MAKNIEIKARATNFERQLAQAKAIADSPAEVLHQKDVFFNGQSGRLKLRYFADGSAELIGYHRDDRPETTASHYHRFPVEDAQTLHMVLAISCGIRGQVVKKRTLLHVGQTRLHFDEVEGLGQFIELEVVLQHDHEEAKGHALANALMQKLSICPDDLISHAYIDMLSGRASAPS